MLPEIQAPLRVLHIEDLEDDTALVTRALRRAGHAVEVRRVETAGELRAALQDGIWEAVISDYTLPHFDALEALEVLHQSGLDLPFIIVSGTIDEVEAVTALRAGAQDFITKSNLTRLAPAIERERREAEVRRQRQAAQALLAEQEASFKLLFEGNPLPMWVYERATLAFLEVNPSAVAHYGYSRDEFLRMDITQVQPPEDVSRLRASLESEQAGHHPSQPYWRHRLKSGQIIDVAITTRTLTFQGREAVLVVAHDITEQRRAEAAREASERRFRALIENSADAITLLGPAGTVMYDSPAAPRLLGYDAQEWIGRSALDIVHPDDLASVQGLLQQLVAVPNQSPGLLIRLRHKDGAWRWIEGVASNLLSDPNVQAIVVNYRDITERREAEAQIRFQAHLLDTVGQAVIATDLEGTILYANRFVETLYGWSAGELIGRGIQAIVPSSVLQEHGDAIQARLRRGEAWTGELLMRRKDGTQFPVQVTDAPVHDQHNQLIGFVGVSTDITERRAAAEALAHSERRFRALIENSSDAITLVNAEGLTIYDSPNAARMLGYEPEELVGRNAFQRMHPDDVAQGQTAVRRAVEGQAPVTGQLRLMHRDGRWRWVEFILTNLLAEPAVQALVVNYRDMTERKEAETQIQQQLNRLAALRAVDLAITSSLDLHFTLSIMLEQVTALLGLDAADVLLLDPLTQTLSYAAGRGFRTRAVEASRVRVGEKFAGRAALEQRMVEVADLSAAGVEFRSDGLVNSEGFTYFVAAPLFAKGSVVGLLEGFHRSRLEPDAEWRSFLEALAGQAAIAIENAKLFDDLQRSNQELVLAYDATIEGWSRALDLRDKETEGHSQRVTALTLRLAQAMGVSQAELVHVHRGALLHDIGKMGIPDHILLKPGPLSDDEWAIMRQHPTFAYELLAPITFLRPALDIPYGHHEKWDGTGYPRGLRGEQIPLAARLFAVVDVWDALRSDRPYRLAWPKERVLEHIRALAGSHFDPRAVEVLFQVVG